MRFVGLMRSIRYSVSALLMQRPRLRVIHREVATAEVEDAQAVATRAVQAQVAAVPDTKSKKHASYY